MLIFVLMLTGAAISSSFSPQVSRGLPRPSMLTLLSVLMSRALNSYYFISCLMALFFTKQEVFFLTISPCVSVL